MSKIIPIFDKDGYAIVKRIYGSATQPSVTKTEKEKKLWGEHKLIPIVDIEDIFAKYGSDMLQRTLYFPTLGSSYDIEYSSKTWQKKAWQYVSMGLSTANMKGFKSCIESERIRNIKRIGLHLVFRAKMATKERPIVATFHSDHASSKSGNYLLMDDYQSFRLVMKDWYTLLTKDLYKYRDIARTKYNDAGLIVIQKLMIIYNDGSYDAVAGNPLYIMKLLNISFNRNTGKMIVNSDKPNIVEEDKNEG